MDEQKAIKELERHIQFLRENWKPHPDCIVIETLGMAINALEKQIPKKAKHIVEKYGKHKWQRKENGEVDDSAWDYEYHNGVVCEVCGETVCVHCEPDYDNKEDCEKSYYVCPTCKEKTFFKRIYCDCGQKLDWSEV